MWVNTPVLLPAFVVKRMDEHSLDSQPWTTIIFLETQNVLISTALFKHELERKK